MKIRVHNMLRFAPTGRGLSLKTILSVWRERRKLAKLDDATLQDLGISRHEAEIEAKRAPWDVPSHWQR